MVEQAFFFQNRSGDHLFGYQHIPQNKGKTGIVFCHPFGEEKHRSYRSIVEFSRYLANNNVPSLRFDMRGSGDSDGDMVEATVDSQVEDTLDAISLFIEKQSLDQVVLIGLRYGAVIAALTADQDTRVKAIVLLSPVIKGSIYWRELLRTRQLSSVSHNQKATRSSELLEELETNGQLEIEAQYVSQTFVSQLQKIDMSNHKPNFSGDILVCDLANDVINKELSSKVIQQYSGKECYAEIYSEEERDYWSNLALYDQFYPDKTFEFSRSWLIKRGVLN